MIVMAIASSRWLMLMTQIIAPCFRSVAAAVPSHEGVFVSVSGSELRNGGEIRMMQIIGGDVVGMSVIW